MATNPRVSSFENYLNSSFGAYPYNSLDRASQPQRFGGPGEQMSPLYRLGLPSSTPAGRPAPLPRPGLRPTSRPGAPAPAAGPTGPAPASGPMPFQLVQNKTSNAPAAGMNFGSMGTSSSPLNEVAANEITNAPVARANSLLAQSQQPVAPFVGPSIAPPPPPPPLLPGEQFRRPGMQTNLTPSARQSGGFARNIPDHIALRFE